MNECRFVAATGMLGKGIDEKSLRQAMQMRPHYVAADAGSTDAGPYALGHGVGSFPREATRDDIAILLRAARPAGIPVLIGSCGTSGADIQVDEYMDIVREVARAEGMSLRVAEIRSDQAKPALKQMLRAGRIRALDPAPHLDAEVIERSACIVGMMSIEPLQAALEQKVDLIVAGRCSDPALYAAMPIMMGLPAGLAWHAGKVVECGTAVCEHSGPGVIYGHVRPDEVLVRGIGEGRRCTTQSVAAHSLYENGDPFLFKENGGELDIRASTYEQVDDVSVRIRGSNFRHADQYTVKLEGAERVGYQTIVIGGVRDPFILVQLDAWLAKVDGRTRELVHKVFGRSVEAMGGRIDYHVYGRDAVMGRLEPLRDAVPHEVGIVLAATAPEQALATKLAQIARQPLLHVPIEKWKGSITGFACLHNPAHIERGPVYEFNLNHVALPDSPTSMFRTTLTQVTGA